MSGSDIAYGCIGLRACYAMSGTDLAYAATCLRVPTRVWCYGMSGTDLAYDATRKCKSCGRSYQHTRMLCDVRYRDCVWLAYLDRVCSPDCWAYLLLSVLKLLPTFVPAFAKPTEFVGYICTGCDSAY
eukprot:488954-Rhodomonas_salina.1